MKAEKRALRKTEAANAETAPAADGQDPDIAGIVPGPQPGPEEDEVE